MDDSTFRAYRKDPRFLSSILPLSPELDFILSRIFEHDPRRRINIPELRELILRCNSFTTRSPSALPPTPPSEPQCVPGPELTCHTPAQSSRGCGQYPQVATPALAAYPVMAQSSTSSGGSDHGSIFSAASSCSSTSSCGSYESVSKGSEIVTYTAPPSTRPIFNCSFAFSGPFMQQACMPSIVAH